MPSSSGQQPVTQQTTQTRDPWSAAQPHLQHAMGAAEQYFNNNYGYQPYSGQTLADLDPTLSESLGTQAYLAGANRFGTAGVLAGQNLGKQMIESQGLSPQLQSLLQQQQGQNNPYLQGAINQQVKGANAAASGMGRYGSGAHDAAIAGAISPIMAQDYARRQQQQQDILQGGLQRAGQWAETMPGLDAAQYAPLERMGAVGQYRQDRSQQQLSDQIKLYNAQQSYPWEQLARYNAIVGGAGGLGGTQVTTSPGAQQPSTLNKIFGGAAAGAGIGGSFGGAPGAGVGAGVGGLLGLL